MESKKRTEEGNIKNSRGLKGTLAVKKLASLARPPSSVLFASYTHLFLLYADSAFQVFPHPEFIFSSFQPFSYLFYILIKLIIVRYLYIFTL